MLFAPHSMGRGGFKNVVEFLHEKDTQHENIRLRGSKAPTNKILSFRAIKKIRFLNDILQSKIGNLVLCIH